MSFNDLPLLYEAIGDLEIFRYVAVVAGLNRDYFMESARVRDFHTSW